MINNSEFIFNLDLSKVIHEMERMEKEEIPFDIDYLNELIEYTLSKKKKELKKENG